MNTSDEWIPKVRKYLTKGDLKDIAQDLQCSESLVSKVYRGEKHNLSVIESLIRKAEERKAHEKDLLRRAEAL